MRLFFKENFLYFISFFVCLACVYYQFSTASNYWNASHKFRQKLYNENCSKYKTQDYENIIIDEMDDDIRNCFNHYKTLMEEKKDTYYTFFATFDEVSPIFPFFTILFVIIPAIYSFHQKNKKGNIKNILTRIKYSDFVKKEYLKSLKAFLIVPIGMLLLFILAYTISGHFNINKTLEIVEGEIYLSYNNYFHPIYFMVVFFINIMIQSIFYINLVYLVDSKNKNLLLTYIETFLIFIGLEVIFEFIESFIYNVLGHSNFYRFTLLDSWGYYYVDKFMLIPIIINIAIVSITFYMMYKIYSNKEKVLMSNE